MSNALSLNSSFPADNLGEVITVKKMIKTYLILKATHRRATTLKSYRKVLDRFMKTPWLNGKRLDSRHELQSIGLEAIHQFKVHLEAQGLTPYTIYTYQGTIVSMIKMGKLLGYRVSWQVLQFPITPVFYTPRDAYLESEVIRLYDAAPEPYKLPFRMAAELGLRVGEVSNIKIKDINWNRNLIKIPQTKNGRPHTVYLTRSMKVGMEALCEGTAYDERPLFLGPRCVGILPGTLRNWHTTAMRASNIEQGSPHSLRHSFVTELVKIGVREYVVKLLVNHYKKGVTESYTHSEDKCREALEQMTIEKRRERLNGG